MSIISQLKGRKKKIIHVIYFCPQIRTSTMHMCISVSWNINSTIRFRNTVNQEVNI